MTHVSGGEVTSSAAYNGFTRPDCPGNKVKRNGSQFGCSGVWNRCGSQVHDQGGYLRDPALSSKNLVQQCVQSLIPSASPGGLLGADCQRRDAIDTPYVSILAGQ